MTHMKVLATTFLIATCGLASLRASAADEKQPTAAMLAPMHALADAFNQEQPNAPDVFTSDCSILDEFAPFMWNGSEGVKAWYGALYKTMQDPKDGHWRVKTFTPKSLQAEGDRAYFLVPSELDYKKDGKPRVQHGDWLFVMAKSGDAWKIAAHSWAVVSDIPSAAGGKAGLKK